MIPANTDFPTACAEMTGVYIGSVCTKGSGHFVSRSKHVFGVALEPVECEVERVVEETEVKTYVGVITRSQVRLLDTRVGVVIMPTFVPPELSQCTLELTRLLIVERKR